MCDATAERAYSFESLEQAGVDAAFCRDRTGLRRPSAASGLLIPVTRFNSSDRWDSYRLSLDRAWASWESILVSASPIPVSAPVGAPAPSKAVVPASTKDPAGVPSSVDPAQAAISRKSPRRVGGRISICSPFNHHPPGIGAVSLCRVHSLQGLAEIHTPLVPALLLDRPPVDHAHPGRDPVPHAGKTV